MFLLVDHDHQLLLLDSEKRISRFLRDIIFVLKEVSFVPAELLYGRTSFQKRMRVALKFAYDGRSFSGYAKQPGQKTIEGNLLQILRENHLIETASHACFRTASRTDRGVSALGNVCAFNTTVSISDISRSFTKDNGLLFLYGVKKVPDDFYPRYAKRRIYRYYLYNDALDVDAVLSAASLFTGEHDFRNFARVEPLKNPVRCLDTIIITEKNDFLSIDFFAETFLWNQIRRIVSALEKAGQGKLALSQIQHALDHPEKRVDFQLAPPEPLILLDVVYDFSFQFSKSYSQKLRRLEETILSSL